MRRRNFFAKMRSIVLKTRMVVLDIVQISLKLAYGETTDSDYALS